MEKLKQFFNTTLGRHIYSFAKTYVTVFIGIYLTLQGVVDGLDSIDPSMLSGINLTDTAILIASAKGGFISLARNAYKLLTE